MSKMLADPVTQLVRALELKCRAQYQREYLGMHLQGMFKELNINKVTELLERLFQFYCKAHEVEVPERSLLQCKTGRSGKVWLKNQGLIEIGKSR